jgi:hypothetical protein
MNDLFIITSAFALLAFSPALILKKGHDKARARETVIE